MATDPIQTPPTPSKRRFFRAEIELEATLHHESFKRELLVTIRNLAPQGAALEVPSDETLPVEGLMLTVPLPTRNNPLEVAVTIVGGVRHKEEGAPTRTLRVTFASISPGDEDAIEKLLNEIRVFERQQRAVTVPAHIVVNTGDRAFASFKGHTLAVRPDAVLLHMDRFDYIKGAGVTLRLSSPDGFHTAEVDGAVEMVKDGAEGFDVQIGVEEPPSWNREHSGTKMIEFVRRYYPESSETGPTDPSAPQPKKPPVMLRPFSAPRPQLAAASRSLSSGFDDRDRLARAPKAGDDVSFTKRARDAQRRGMQSILRPPPGAPRQRSV